ncbi:MAG: hypothetical protein SF187_05190 [Deltaproteobacteria bacterium]|nr:hypothetical protein [Deltaproteobacteria bacterium]
MPLTRSAVLFLVMGFAPSAFAAKISVDWNKPTGAESTSAQYGLNLFKVYNPSVSQQNPAYKRELARMAPGMLRIHSWNMMGDSASGDGWIRDGVKASYAWDETKIVAALKDVTPVGSLAMMNIPAWPSFLGSSDKPLDPSKLDAFADFCAQLVQIVNVKAKYGIKYWEVTNERDGVYSGKGADLAAVVLAAAKAMRKVDPTIKVGGPAFTQPWHQTVGDFLTASVAQLDFISYHTYSTGDGKAPLQGLFDSAAGLGGIAKYMRGEIAKRTTRKLEVFHNEYNISWAPPDARMNGVEGAVFDALALMSFAGSEVAGSAAWNEADGWYGKLDGELNPRPASYVFELFNRLAVGKVVKASSDDDKTVSAMAVSRGDAKALFLVNRTTAAVMADVTGFDDRQTSAMQVTKDGRAAVTVARTGAVNLPPLSLTVLTAGQASSGAGGQGGMAQAQGGAGGAVVTGTAGAGGAASASQGGDVGNARGGSSGGAAGAFAAGADAGGAGGADEGEAADTEGSASGCLFASHVPPQGGLAWLTLVALLLWRGTRRLQ